MKTASKHLWVKASEIMAETGWDKKKMHRARTYGWIDWRKDKKLGFIYDLNSVPEKLKQTA